MHRLEMVQLVAVRVVLQIKRNARQQSITTGLTRLHWLPVKWRIEFNILVLVFKCPTRPKTRLNRLTRYVRSRLLRSEDCAFSDCAAI